MILTNLYKKFSYRIDDWINEGSGWIIKSIDAKYLNISLYCPLSGRSYIELPDKLKNSMKGLINIKNSDNKYFLWCHIRSLNPLKIRPERIIKVDKKLLMILIAKLLIFLFLKKTIARLKRKIIFALGYFLMKMIWFNLFMYQIKNLTKLKIKTLLQILFPML